MKIILKTNLHFNDNVYWYIKKDDENYLYIETESHFTTRIALSEIANINEIDFTNKSESISFAYEKPKQLPNDLIELENGKMFLKKFIIIKNGKAFNKAGELLGEIKK